MKILLTLWGLRWLKTVLFWWESCTLTRTLAQGIKRSPKGSRDSARDLKFALFLPSLVSCLQYHLFLTSKTSILLAISNTKKHSFISLCLNVNKTCDVHVAINRDGYQSKTQQEKLLFKVFFVLFTRPVSPSGIYGTLLILLTTTAKTKTLFVAIVAGSTEQRTSFTRAQSAILQSRHLIWT